MAPEAPSADQAIYADLHQQPGQVIVTGATQVSEVSLADSPVVAAAVISWDGGGDGTSWHDPLNWSGNVVPGAADDVTISLSGSNPTITFSTASGTRSVRSIVCNEAFVLSGGSLTVTGGPSQFTSNFSLTGGSLTATGVGATLSTSPVTGLIITLTGGSVTATAGASITFPTVTALTDMNLNASGGGKIYFPAATSYADGGYGQTIQASGAGSLIDLGHLATFDGGDYSATQIKALDGGIVVIGCPVTGAVTFTESGGGTVIRNPVSSEVTVSGNSISISGGDTTPSMVDGTDFGSAPQGGTPVSHSFTVRNTGTATLTLGAVTLPAGFMLTEGLSASLAPGASDTFTVRLDTAVAGTKSGDISFSTNDGYGGDGIENPFNFRITGVVISAPSPEITVLGSGISIKDGDTTPSTTDGTDFGKVATGGASILRTFAVRNDGGGTLTLGAVSVPAGFTLVEGLSASLAPGASDTFTVQLNTATAGTYSGYISFGNNDSNENPYNFKITGVVGPEITVLGNGRSIVDGDTSPSTTDGTDFGKVAVGSAPITRTFTVRNDGGGTLTLGAVALPTGFTLVEGLPTSVAPGASVTFTVRLDTAVAGTKTGDLTFTTNDPNESPYNFQIKGAVGPELTVLGNGRSIVDGDISPSTTDGTSFGTVAVGSTPVTRTFTVRNDGGGTLLLGSVSVPTGFTLVQPLVASLAPGASATFTVRLDTTLAGTKVGDIIFTTNDPDENPFNFRITGIVTV